MRKQFAVFIILILIPAAYSIQFEQKNSFHVDNEIRGLKIDSNSVFTSTAKNFYGFREGDDWRDSTNHYFAWAMDSSTNLVLGGTKNPGHSLIVYNKTTGDRISKIEADNWIDSASIYQQNGEKIFVAGYTGDIDGFKIDGEHLFDLNPLPNLQGLSRNSFDLDRDGEKEFISTGSNPNNRVQVSVYNLQGEREWATDPTWTEGRGIGGNYIGEQEVLVYYSGTLKMFSGSGEEKWSRSVEAGSFRPVNLSERIVFSSGSELVFLDRETGETLEKVKVEGGELTRLKRFPGKEWLVGFQEENVSIVNLEGEQLATRKIEGLRKGPRFADRDSDGLKEIGVATERSIRILDLVNVEEKEKVNKSLEEVVFVGNGREALKAVALNASVIPAESFGEVEGEVEELNRTAVGLGEVEGLDSIENINEAFNVSRQKWFVDSRKKAVYAAALAAEENATLTFEKERADRDLSNLSVEELRERFIEEFRPHHVAVADLESGKGVLASYMAVKQSVLPVDFEEEWSYPGERTGTEYDLDVEEINRDNGVIKLERKLREVFDEIGENRNTIFEGKHVSLLEAPRKLHLDPAERGLFDDKADGNYFYSDLNYGDLDGDRRLEASVGRYPEELGDASLAYRNSLEREKGEKALVASEYLQGRWPMVLATLGGGMWDGKNFYHILENEGFNTTLLVEQRSKPVMLIFDLLGMPTKMDQAVKSVKNSQAALTQMAGSTAAAGLKNAVMMIRGLSYAEHSLEVYLEHRWMDWQPLRDLQFPEKASFSEVKKAVRSFLPERHPRISEQSLRERLGRNDVIVYSGVGNESAWIMPNNVSGWLESRYNGSNKLLPGEVPRTENSIVWDSSNNAGTRKGEFRESFMEKGASNFIGASSASYSSYNAVMVEEFLAEKQSVGESFRSAVNDLRTSSLIYAPEAWFTSGIKQKMQQSLTLYGNPETVKDPLPEEELNTSRSCVENLCELEVSVNPEPEIITTEKGKRAVFNTSDYLLRPGVPITPLYKFSRELPDGAEVVDYSLETGYRKVSGLESQELVPVSHGGRSLNRSLNYTVFPQNTSRVNVSGRVEAVVAGAQYRENSGKVLEKMKFSLEYRSPNTVDLELRNRSLYADVEIEERAKLAYSVDGEREVVEVNNPGKVRLEALDPGEHDVEAYLYDQKILSQDSEKFTVAEPVEVLVFAPDTRVGEQRRFTAIARNPNDFRVKKKLAPELSENIQLGFFEDRRKKVEIGAENSRKVSWRFNGVREGNATVSVMRGSEDIEVRPAMQQTREIMALGAFLEKGVTLDLEMERSSEGVKAEVKSPQGTVKFRKNSSSRRTVVKTSELKIVEYASPEKSSLRIETPNQAYKEVESGGVTRKTGRMKRARVERYREMLEREQEKLLEHFGNTGQYVED